MTDGGVGCLQFKGQDVRLQTFGAIHVQPRDPAGKPLQMASGKSVDVSLPIHPVAKGSAPDKIPFFIYEEATGLWTEHGELQRVGGNYIGKITHFSEFNADSTFGSSACMKIQFDQNPVGGFPSAVILNASYTDPTVGNFNHPNTLVSDTQNPIVIERLAPDADFNLIISDATTHANLQTVLLNSGPSVSVPFPVPFPYDGCKPAVVFNNGATIPPTSDHFLITGTIIDSSSDYKTQTTTGSYAGRDTLTGWKNANGFTAGAAETRASYFNNGDLQFGRDMHCRDVSHAGSGFSQNWIACYVTNFGSVGIDFNHQPGNPVNDAYTNANPVATVAMEWHPEQTDKVQFWAFKGNGDYLPAPALDVEGGKPMPQICIGCHRGSYDDSSAGHLAHGSVFLPFDVDAFLGDDGNALAATLGTTNPNPAFHRPTQENFRQLNQFALKASDTTTTTGTAPSAAFQRLMDLWYKDGGHPHGVNDAGATYHFNQGAAQLGGFAAHTALYDAVVRPVCRTCHIAFQNTDINTGETWESFQQMSTFSSAIEAYACATGFGVTSPNGSPHHSMPHAQVPYKRFWQSSLASTLGTQLGFTCQ